MSELARILLVDDDEALLEALPEALLLRMSGIEVDTADSGLKALERIRRIDYDAIVSDIKMPGMDGLALLTATKELRPGTPILLITGHGEHDLAVQALRGGAYDFVQKPIDRDYFVASLERAMRMRRLDRQVADQQALLEQHARVLEHVDNGVVLVDADEKILYWNPSAEAITGIPAASVLGRPVGEALPGWDAIVGGVPVSPEPGPSARDATVPLDVSGRELWLSLSGVEFDGGVVYAFRNLTEERALDELKSEFVATVSHELRTPLSAIYGCAQTLRRSDVELDDETEERLLEVIAHECERLTRIVSDMLLANQLDAGRMRLVQEEIEVDSAGRRGRRADARVARRHGDGRAGVRVATRPGAGSRGRGQASPDPPEPRRQRRQVLAGGRSRGAAGRAAGGWPALRGERPGPRDPPRRAAADLRQVLPRRSEPDARRRRYRARPLHLP